MPIGPNVLAHIFIGTGIGVVMAGVWRTYTNGEKKATADFYRAYNDAQKK